MNSNGPSESKKIWSREALLKAMQPTSEELEYRKEKSKETDFLQKYTKFLKCSKCQFNIKPLIVKHEKVPIHPCLGVLMCQKCCNYYEDGEFSLDSDGEDKYCRWCGEGGTIFSCSKCICGFCVACIKRHFKLDYYKQVQKDENWLCFFCNPKPLWERRFICSLAVHLSESVDLESSSSNLKSDKKESFSSCESLDVEKNNIEIQHPSKTVMGKSRKKICFKNRKESSGESQSESMESKNLVSPVLNVKGKSKKKIYTSSSSSDESDIESPLKKVKFTSTPLESFPEKKESDSFENLKPNVLSEVKKILELSKHQMEFGVNFSSKMLEKLEKQNDDQKTSCKGVLKECKKIKWFLSTLSTYLVQFSNSVSTIERAILKNDGQKISLDCPDKDQSAYTSILQFLGFVKNQVKTFMETGMSFPEVLEAEVYNDEKVLGIKKKPKQLSENSNQAKRNFYRHNCRGNDSDASNSNESTDEHKVNESDKSRDDFFDLVMDQSFEKEDTDVKDEDFHKDYNSSSTTIFELNELETVDSKEDIQKIIAILENA